MGVAQNEASGVTQVFVFGFICQGASLVHVFDPQLYRGRSGGLEASAEFVGQAVVYLTDHEFLQESVDLQESSLGPAHLEPGTNIETRSLAGFCLLLASSKYAWDGFLRARHSTRHWDWCKVKRRGQLNP